MGAEVSSGSIAATPGGPPLPTYGGRAVTLGDFLLACRERLYTVLAIWLIFLLAACGAAFLMKPVYRAFVLVLPVTQDGGSGGGLGDIASKLGGVASLAGVDLGKGSGANGRDETMAVLTSRALIGEFITDHKLLPLLFPRDWDSARGAWKSEDRSHSLADGIDQFLRKVFTVKDRVGSTLVDLRVDWPDRTVGVQWANELVVRLNETMRKRASERATKNLEFLYKELDQNLSLEARTALSRLLETQVKAKMMASVTPDYALRVIDPATEPDVDDYVRPQRALLIAAGFVLGAAAAGFYVVLRMSLAGRL